ncbi:DUF1330 domain-containing protein [Pseudooceanicola sp.]|uniref:DUF1330 domain-containing protein n=1 Tax=Pseudooceanicola sp. TaxID=1914328 RepID=UPI002620F152|nr:DUF1330 domain-containing protein [Pseudooceanicola sp.]MDF1856802.1 DUF1330 domain-containing protein [Pseudooceanicola sp.]
MPCYVITQTHFSEADQLRDFSRALRELGRGTGLQVTPLDDAKCTNPLRPDQSFLMEFSDAARAHAFMASREYRSLIDASETASAG